MSFAVTEITVNANSRRQVKSNTQVVAATQDQRPKFVYGDTLVLGVHFIDADGNDYALNAGDTFDCGLDKDFAHVLDQGTAGAGYSGAVTSIVVSGLSTPSTLPSTGQITLTNGAGSSESVSYTAFDGTDTFTVSVTLTYTYLTGDTIKVDDELMAYSDNDEVDIAGDWADINRSQGKISIRVNCLTDSFLNKVDTADDILTYLQIRRVPNGETAYTTMLQDTCRSFDAVVGTAGSPGVSFPQYLTQTLGDARYLQVYANYSEIGAALADADQINIIDGGAGGTVKKANMSRVNTYVSNSTGLDTLTTEYRGVFVDSAGVVTESTSIQTNAAGSLLINAAAPIGSEQLYVNGDVYVTGAGTIANGGSGRALQISQTSATNASALALYSNTIHTGTGTTSLALIQLDNASSTGDALSVIHDGTGDACVLKRDSATLGPVLKFTNDADTINASGVLGRQEYFSGDNSANGDRVVARYGVIQEASTPVAGAFIWEVSTSGTPSEVMRLLSGGTLCINATAAIGSEKVYVNGSLQVGAFLIPATDGTANQILETDGAGTLSWVDPSGAGVAFIYEYDNTTAKADPGAGKIRGNNTTIASITEFYIDDIDNHGIDMSSVLDALGPSDHWLMKSATLAPTESALFTVDSVTDETGYYTIAVTFVDRGSATTWTDATDFGILPLFNRDADYAGVSFDDNASATTIPLVNSFILIQDWDTNGPDDTSTSDQANNRLTVGATGTYFVSFGNSSSSAGTGKTYEWDVFEISSTATSITAATQADPVVITASGHGLSNGNKVKITGVTGMTEINDRVFTVAGVSGANFNLQDDSPADIDGTGFTAYSAGGTVQLATETGVHTHRRFSTTDVGAAGRSYPASLTSGSSIEVYVKGITDATNITHESGNLSAFRIGASGAGGGGGGGKVLQMVNTQDASKSNTATTMPNSTRPDNADGMELMTLAITPNDASNLLRIDVVVNCAISDSGNIRTASIALFQDSAADALSGAGETTVASEYITNLKFTHWMTAGTTSSTTFKVRGGADVGTFYYNGGSGGGSWWGGYSASSITITEIEA
jgi:hypothetical protein